MLVVVTQKTLDSVLSVLEKETALSLDTETSGLRPFHGDRMFALIIGTATDEYYFNFKEYPAVEKAPVIDKKHLFDIQFRLFDRTGALYYIHNASNFDMQILKQDGLEIKGKVHCTKVMARVEYNERPSHSLDDLAPLVGLEKSDVVEKYIDDNKLWEWVNIPGKSVRDKVKHFDQVPFSIMVEYGARDVRVGYNLGVFQAESIARQTGSTPPGLPSLFDCFKNESRLTHTIARMEHVGVRIDKEYCMRAARYEQERATSLLKEFESTTGQAYKASPKFFEQIFADCRDRWTYTDKGNPSFDADALKLLSDHPAGKIIMELRDAKSKADFYQGFLYHADSAGDIHPSFNSDGARHGRFSSSNPNFQNLTSEEGQENQEFLIRRAIIPRPGYIFYLPDYDQMEYRLMLELAADLVGHETDLIRLVNGGLDVHQATAQVASAQGIPITRSEAKTTNFLTIYGGGNQKLADGLKCSLSQAAAIRGAIFKASPEMKKLVDGIQSVATRRGFIFNWLGRRCYFPNSRFAYRAPNYLIAGGCADVVKVAMNRLDDLFIGKKSRMVLTIHDELPIELHESELHLASQINEIMETVYKSTYLKLTCGKEHSYKSLADKVKGLP